MVVTLIAVKARCPTVPVIDAPVQDRLFPPIVRVLGPLVAWKLVAPELVNVTALAVEDSPAHNDASAVAITTKRMNLFMMSS